MTPKILVIDDDPEYVERLRGVLGLLGIAEFDVANDVAGANAAFKPGKYDLAIVDIMLPKGLEGMSLITRFRNWAGTDPAKGPFCKRLRLSPPAALIAALPAAWRFPSHRGW